jgi:hypothetical protein
MRPEISDPPQIASSIPAGTTDGIETAYAKLTERPPLICLLQDATISVQVTLLPVQFVHSIVRCKVPELKVHKNHAPMTSLFQCANRDSGSASPNGGGPVQAWYGLVLVDRRSSLVSPCHAYISGFTALGPSLRHNHMVGWAVFGISGFVMVWAMALHLWWRSVHSILPAQSQDKNRALFLLLMM